MDKAISNPNLLGESNTCDLCTTTYPPSCELGLGGIFIISAHRDRNFNYVTQIM